MQNILISIIVVGVFCAVLYFMVKRSKGFKNALLQNGFEIYDDCPEYIENICKELFDSRLYSDHYYRAHVNSKWGDDSWVISFNPGRGDSPSQEVLITKELSQRIPEFVLGMTENITTTHGLYKYIDYFNPLKKIGFHCLPDTCQPFLRKRKGIVVYAREDVDIKPMVLPAVLDSLRSGGYGGAAFFKGRIVVWTYAQVNTEKLIVIARALQEGLNCAAAGTAT